jgi:hypothetical protein
MFRKNEEHRQQSFFSGHYLLPDKLQDRLLTSWAETFYQKLFCRIDEESFAPLYSEEASRPNVPINVLMGLEVLKSGFGWSDEELHEQVCFNLQVRHALGLRDLRSAIFTLRTLYNFRRRVREYEEETGVNLFQKAFEQVTDEQLEIVELATGWQRMDSTQVLSNLKKMTRLELLVAVLQAVHKRLPESMKDQWAERWVKYLERRPHQVSYRIAADEVEDHLVIIGQELCAVSGVLEEQAPGSEVLGMVQRVLEEQYKQDPDGNVHLRPGAEIASDSLQSPHDPDATYRIKGGATYPGGYVVNVSETADPENDVQLITDVQVEPNRADDTALMEQSLDDQARRGIEVNQVTVDGGYTGPKGEEACGKHEARLRPTRMRGGQTAPDHWGWKEYTWEVEDDGTPVRVACSQRCTAAVFPGRAENRFLARFEDERCAACPFFKTKCRVQGRKRLPPTLYVTRRRVEIALRRQQMSREDASVRAVVESTIRSLKRAFPGSKLPVRGLIRARMVLYPAAMMVNLRRLHRHLVEEAEKAAQVAVSSLSSLKTALFRCLKGIHRRLWPLTPQPTTPSV